MRRLRSTRQRVPSILTIIIWISFTCYAYPAHVFGFDTIQLARQITQSLGQVSHNPKYSTVSFSRILGDLDKETVNEIIDYTENEIVQSRSFRVIDRSKLQMILREQKFNLTGMVSSDTYKELGKLLGVDLFIYGRYYSDVIVLKAIDVDSSAIIWGDIFQIGELSKNSVIIENLAMEMTESIKKDLPRLRANKIRQISFWGIKSDFNAERVIDFLSVAITKDGNFQVVDRENLKLILEEQKLNMEDFIDQSQAKKMGELYGVDAFIYGRISSKPGRHVASLKMLNIYNGVIEWAKTIRFGEEKKKRRASKSGGGRKSGKMAYVGKGMFIMGVNKGAAISSPAFKRPLNAFYIDLTEVSNSEYETFVKKFRHRAPPSWLRGKIPPGKEDHPVVMVSWKDANRYCVVHGKRLPKEAEWEKAFRGSRGKKYPWAGSTFNPGYARTVESGVLMSMKVYARNKDISEFGVRHLAGNVREWVDSYLRAYPGSRYHSKRVGRERVIRGGSWATNSKSAVGWYRSSSPEDYGWKDVGFRCARSAK